MQLLEQVESLAEKEPITVVGISDGRQSRVTVLRFKFPQSEQLIMWERMGVGKGLSEAEASVVLERLRPYRRSLRDYGWNIPKLFHTHVAHVDKEWQIYSYE